MRERTELRPVPGLHGEHVIEVLPGFPVFRLEEASLDGLNASCTEGDIFGSEAAGEWYMVFTSTTAT